MLYNFQKQAGFTLIELLVVIAIIGILSAVVLTSLNDARNSAKDANIIQQAKQLSTVMELHISKTGDYPHTAAPNDGRLGWYSKEPVPGQNWVFRCYSHPGHSSWRISGPYEDEIRKLCQSIVDLNGEPNLASLHIGVDVPPGGANPPNAPTRVEDNQNHYSIMAKLNAKTSGGDNIYFCIGSSGATYTGTPDPDGAGPLLNWDGPGCHRNP